MKFEVGKKYQTRKGYTVTLAADLSSWGANIKYPLVFVNEDGTVVTKDCLGYDIRMEHPSDYDVIAEWKEPLKRIFCTAVSLKSITFVRSGSTYTYGIDWADHTDEWNGKKVRVTLEEVRE